MPYVKNIASIFWAERKTRTFRLSVACEFEQIFKDDYDYLREEIIIFPTKKSPYKLGNWVRSCEGAMFGVAFHLASTISGTLQVQIQQRDTSSSSLSNLPMRLEVSSSHCRLRRSSTWLAVLGILVIDK
uniref:Uncharacterized protein n=1 Tax=Phytophthora infestans TaxID=4787 RepID=Q572J4_PHYIN|nr:hypothetical protein PI35.0310c [Phytophthora infestans]